MFFSYLLAVWDGAKSMVTLEGGRASSAWEESLHDIEVPGLEPLP